KAENEWTEAANGAAGFLPLYLSLAELKLQSGDTDSAVKYARQAVNINPASPDARLLLAQSTRSIQDYKAASTLFEESIRRNPNGTRQIERMAAALEGQQDLAGAEAQYEAALKLQPDSEGALNGLVRTYIA